MAVWGIGAYFLADKPEDIPEDLSGKIGSVSHLQNHSAKRNRIALFANRAPIHFGCFRRKKGPNGSFRR